MEVVGIGDVVITAHFMVVTLIGAMIHGIMDMAVFTVGTTAVIMADSMAMVTITTLIGDPHIMATATATAMVTAMAGLAEAGIM